MTPGHEQVGGGNFFAKNDETQNMCKTTGLASPEHNWEKVDME
jgi:hypothetical protein